MYTIIIFFFLSWKFKLNLESIQFFEALILNWKLIYRFHQKQIVTTSHLTNNFSILKKSHSNWFHLNWFHIHKDFSFRKLLFSPPIWAIFATWSYSTGCAVTRGLMPCTPDETVFGLYIWMDVNVCIFKCNHVRASCTGRLGYIYYYHTILLSILFYITISVTMLYYISMLHSCTYIYRLIVILSIYLFLYMMILDLASNCKINLSISIPYKFELRS